MKISIICHVVDNFGDAGVSLRLARGLISHPTVSVDIWTDDTQTFRHLLSAEESMQSASNRLCILPLQAMTSYSPGDVLIEAFGSPVPEGILESLKADLQQGRRQSQPVWLVLDYLSAETWVEDFHLSRSISPDGLIHALFFYPGFTERTGGLIHDDWIIPLEDDTVRAYGPGQDRKALIFSYPQAPLSALLMADADTQFFVPTPAGQPQDNRNPRIQHCEFVPQSRFDGLLMQFDWLFVRGEDSFVRAQLSGKPFVWQIYPTDDQAHLIKLSAFFQRYATGLPDDVKNDLWSLWICWNTPACGPKALEAAWTACLSREDVIQTHNRAWSRHLRQQKSLVRQLLTTIQTELVIRH